MRLFTTLIILCSCLIGFADEAGLAPSGNSLNGNSLNKEKIRASIVRALPLLEQGASGSAEKRTCFTCHNQGMTVLALTEAEKRGIEINHQVLQQQVRHTWEHLARGKAGYLAGKGQGGQVMTAGYAMWTLEVAGQPADDTTAAVAHYLVETQRERQRWTGGGNRPPSSGSGFTSSYLAIRALAYFGTAELAEAIDARHKAAAEWILKNEAHDTEDLVFKCLTLPYIGADEATVQAHIDRLLAMQHPNGGWGQTEQMETDAYATGSVLTALQEVGALQSTHPSVVAGYKYLLDSQLADGSWHVTTRAEPIQEYYESGFPHGEDQFISIAATAWSALALTYALPKVETTSLGSVSSSR